MYNLNNYFKFLLICFIFSLFCFVPKANASEIRLFSSDYSLVDSCQSNLCVFNNPSGASKRIRFIPDTLTADANTSYTNKFNFQVLSSYNDLNISTCDWFINNQSFSYTSQTFSRLSNVYFSTNIWQSDFTFQNTRTFVSAQTYSSFLECEMNQSSVIRRVSFNHILSVNSSGSNEDIINSNNTNTTNIINNNNNNTQNIIDNQNQNTQDIIDNQNQNTQQQIDSQKVCTTYNRDNVLIKGYLNNNGTITVADNAFSTNFINITNSEIKVLTSSSVMPICFYDVDKVKISCSSNQLNGIVTIPTNSKFVRFSITYSSNKPIYEICTNGNQALNDALTDSNVNVGTDLFGDITWYDNNQFSSIITSPLNFLNSLNDSCTPVNLSLFGSTISLPCGTTIFWDLDNSYIVNFRAFWNVIFGGLIIYRLSLKLILTVNNAIDPTKDEIGGLDI